MSGSDKVQPAARASAGQSRSLWTADITTKTQAVAFMRGGGVAALLVGFLLVATAPSAMVQVIATVMYGGLGVGLFCYARPAAVLAMLWALLIDGYLVVNGTVHRMVGGFLGEQHLVPAPGTALGMHMAPLYPATFTALWWAAALPCLAALVLTWVFWQALRAAFLYHDLT
jgi:hypothetical protein